MNRAKVVSSSVGSLAYSTMSLTIRSLFIFSLVMLFPLLSMAQLSDSFDDGDFSSAPAWSGDDADFEIDSEFQLHLIGPEEPNTSHLSTLSQAINDAQWDISCRMDFNPSGSNLTRVYLTSTSPNLEGNLDGYFVLLGTSADDVSLYRQDGSSVTQIIDGTDDLLDVAAVDIAIRVTRSASGDWELLHDLGHTGTYTSEGSTNDFVYTSSNYFGVYCDYTATRHDLFFFDDVIVTGEGFMDTESPTLTSLTVVNEQTLQANFNEALDAASAETVANYTWLPDNNPLSASLSGTQVTLTFGTSFPENVSQSLEIIAVEDIAGNSIAPTTESFTYAVTGTPEAGSVVINEIMADPSPVIGMPEAEFIELYNASDEAYNLEGWNLQNSEADEILDAFVLLPDSYVIICDDDDAGEFSVYGDVLSVSTLSALSNSGDDLRIFSPDSQLIDEVVYSSAWYGGPPANDGGYTLERKNPFLSCPDPTNWQASIHPDGGTPAEQNSVFVSSDTQAPNFISLSAIDASTLELEFSESMDELSIILGSYTLNTGEAILPETTDELNVARLSVSPALTAGNQYTLSYAGLTDCSGNALADGSVDFYIPQEPEVGDVIFNEIMADPTPAVGLPESEYLEIYNRSDKVLDLRNWVLRNGTSDEVLGSHILLPGAYLVLCPEESLDAFIVYGDALGIPSFDALGNAGDELTLFDNEGEILDQVNYSEEWYQNDAWDNGGHSLELINPELPCSNGFNWKVSAAEIGGTPAAVNANLDLSPDTQAPDLTNGAIIGTQQIALSFSEPLSFSSIEEENVNITPEISIVGIIPGQENTEVLIITDDALQIGQVYTVTLTNVTDCSGNVISSINSVDVAIPEAHLEGDLVINEVLFNPYTGGVDFVELYNRSNRSIDLSTWKFANREMGDLANVEAISEELLVILPGEIMAFTENRQNIYEFYPLSRRSQIKAIVDLPTYADDEGHVILMDNAGAIHDEFYYQKDYHFDLISDQNGVSLERIDYDRLTNDPTNWHSAASNVGFATPGYENSQLQPANGTGDAFSLEPDVFSPDNDGFQDVLNITYSLEQPGSAANITIYDSDGRLVRRLVRNQLLSTKGTLSWDGIRDDGRKARIGVHILLIELIQSNGETSSTKKSCVLGGRL